VPERARRLPQQKAGARTSATAATLRPPLASWCTRPERSVTAATLRPPPCPLHRRPNDVTAASSSTVARCARVPERASPLPLLRPLLLPVRAPCPPEECHRCHSVHCSARWCTVPERVSLLPLLRPRLPVRAPVPVRVPPLPLFVHRFARSAPVPERVSPLHSATPCSPGSAASSVGLGTQPARGGWL
jgi:hypothetical protein